jgi:hypothetical protein
MKYFYIENEEQKGPLSLEELISKSISEKTLIWHDGLDGWTEAKNIAPLETHLKMTTPPKIPLASKEPPKFETPKQSPTQPSKVESKNNSKVKMISIVAGAILLLVIGIYFGTKSDNSGQDYETNNEITNNDKADNYSNEGSSGSGQTEYQESDNIPTQQYQQPKPRQLSEEEIRENLYNKEISNPSNYLSADGTYRVNLAANTIIEGTIYNSASIAGFKNIKLTAKFFSKTDVLLGKESFLVMDFISPNGSLPFKGKISGWWDNIDHWSLTVNTAESY